MDAIERVREKLDEYGIEIYTDYALEDHEYVFMVENMAVFINTKEHGIGLSFHAETRPDTVATQTLIMKQVEGIEDIEIMESFVVDAGNKFISGEKAFKLVQQRIESQVIGVFVKEHAYSELLMTEKCYEC